MNKNIQLESLAANLLRPNFQANFWFQATWTILRVVAGTVMVHNGLDKLSDIESFARAYVEYLGLPFPIFLSYCAAYTELIGAPLLAVGLLTRPAALGLFGTMCVAMFHHISVAGLSLAYLELSALYAACFLGFLVNGAGEFSLDMLLAKGLRKLANKKEKDQRDSLESSYLASESEAVATKE